MNETVDSADHILHSQKRAAQTFNRDRIRGACNGILETCLQTFGLLIVIREFHAPGSIKSLLVAAYPAGLLLTPITLFWFARQGWPASTTVSRNYAVAAVAFLAAALAPNLFLFILGSLLAAMILGQQMPLMVHIYSENYAPSRRGQLLSSSVALSVAVATIFSLAGGALLDFDLSTYRWLYVVAAGASLIACVAVSRIPSSPLSPTGSRNPLANLALAWKDRMFGAMLGAWMLMGMGNLITVPLRIEYMANPAYGINATNAQIAMATAVIPSLVRVFTTHLWGYFFDRFDFFLIRMALNGFALAAILLFFASTTLWHLFLAGGILGFAVAGSNIAWSLWVTKFAPANRAPDYMSVHTFATGIRGVMAPFIGFAVIVALSPLTTGIIAASLIGTSILLLIPIRQWALSRTR